MRLVLALLLGVLLGAGVMILLTTAPGVWYEYNASPITTVVGRQLLSEGWQVDRLYGAQNAFAVLRRPRVDVPLELALSVVMLCIGVAVSTITAVLVAEHRRAP